LDSVVGVVTRLRTGWNGVRILAGSRYFFLSLQFPNRFWGQFSFLFDEYREERGWDLNPNIQANLTPPPRISGFTSPHLCIFMDCTRIALHLPSCRILSDVVNIWQFVKKYPLRLRKILFLYMQYIKININEVDLYKTCKDPLEYSRTSVECILNTNFYY
jgi:hypothetical protein